MKGLEDLGLKYDGTVRTGMNIVLQYVYSDFNLDHTRLKTLTLNTIAKSNSDIEKEYTFSESEIKTVIKECKLSSTVVKQLNENYMKELLGFRDLMRITQRVISLNYKTLLTEYQFPVNLHRLINDEINNIREKDTNEFCSPQYILDKINYILKPEITQLIHLMITF